MIKGRLVSFMDVGEKTVLSVEFPHREDAVSWLSDSKKEKLEVTVEKPRKKRSLNANAYMWVLLDQLAEKLRTSAKELYRDYILHYGVYTPLTAKSVSLRTFQHGWESRGDGWIVVVEADYGEKMDLRCYYGSSIYNSKQMSRLIDQVVEDCNEQGIEIMMPAELEELKERWGKDHE